MFNLFNKIKQSSHKAIVLMYHRIASLETDPWQLAVSSQNFEEQLQILKKQYQVISIDDLITNLANKKFKRKTVCLTFDDAYVDNYLFAKPLLEKYDFPATFFIPSSFIGSQKLFWWDELERIILHSESLPKMISIEIKNELYEFNLRDAVLTTELRDKHKRWVWTNKVPSQRCELFLEIWKRLKPLLINEIVNIIEQIKQWAKCEIRISAENLPMNATQLCEISNHPLFKVGVHTATHPALSAHATDVQYQEIAACRDALEQLTGKKVNSIAYPYGDYNNNTITIVKEQGLFAAFTTQAKPIDERIDSFRLGRFQVINQSGKDFEKQMQLWIG